MSARRGASLVPTSLIVLIVFVRPAGFDQLLHHGKKHLVEEPAQLVGDLLEILDSIYHLLWFINLPEKD